MSTYDVEDTYNTAMTPRDPSPEESKKVDYSCEYVKIKLMEPMDLKFWRAVLTESIVTGLFLFSTISAVMTFAGTPSALLAIAFSFGISISVLVYNAAPVSQGHVNPAVSLALALTGKITILRCVLYTVAQIVGATAGVATARSLNIERFNEVDGGANKIFAPTVGGALIGEMFGTTMLVYTVLVACDRFDAKHISITAPLTIGLSVFLAHLSLLSVTNCSINPARSLSSSIISGYWASDFWVFIIGPYLGAIFTTLFYELIKFRSGLDD